MGESLARIGEVIAFHSLRAQHDLLYSICRHPLCRRRLNRYVVHCRAGGVLLRALLAWPPEEWRQPAPAACLSREYADKHGLNLQADPQRSGFELFPLRQYRAPSPGRLHQGRGGWHYPSGVLPAGRKLRPPIAGGGSRCPATPAAIGVGRHRGRDADGRPGPERADRRRHHQPAGDQHLPKLGRSVLSWPL